jgi:hypothetical protein
MSQRDHNKEVAGATQSGVTRSSLGVRTDMYGKNISTVILVAVLALPAAGAVVASVQMSPEWQSAVFDVVTNSYSVVTELSPSSAGNAYGLVFTFTLLLSAVVRGLREKGQ